MDCCRCSARAEGRCSRCWRDRAPNGKSERTQSAESRARSCRAVNAFAMRRASIRKVSPRPSVTGCPAIDDAAPPSLPEGLVVAAGACLLQPHHQQGASLDGGDARLIEGLHRPLGSAWQDDAGHQRRIAAATVPARPARAQREEAAHRRSRENLLAGPLHPPDTAVPLRRPAYWITIQFYLVAGAVLLGTLGPQLANTS